LNVKKCDDDNDEDDDNNDNDDDDDDRLIPLYSFGRGKNDILRKN